MKNLLLGTVAYGLLATGAVTAQKASISFVHGIPGLSAPVEVFANNAKLFSFDYADKKGPIDISAGSYQFDIKLNGQTVLSAKPTLAADKSYTAIAHLKEKSGIQLSLFENDLSFTKVGGVRVGVHHTAMAPAVDVLVRQGNNAYTKLFSNVSNPARGVVEVTEGAYDVALAAAGNTQIAFGPASVRLLPDRYYGIYAIGELGKSSFQLFVLEFPVRQRPAPATLSVIHGIPNLPASVDVFADGNKLFSFDYGDVKGPLSLAPGSYKIEAKLNGKTVLSATPTLETGVSYSAIAHLKETTGIQLSLFKNDVSPAKTGNARLSVRHTAMAPAVDVLARVSGPGNLAAIAKNLKNPNDATLEVTANSYDVALAPANTSNIVFGPAKVSFTAKKLYTVYAVGEVGKQSFRLIVEALDLLPPITGKIQGKSCGGAISVTPLNPQFDENIVVGLKGAPVHAPALLHIGSSDKMLGNIKLPFDLGVAGLTGCFLYQSSEVIVPFQANASGEAHARFFWPSNLAEIKELHFQWSFASGATLKLTDYATLMTN